MCARHKVLRCGTVYTCQRGYWVYTAALCDTLWHLSLFFAVQNPYVGMCVTTSYEKTITPQAYMCLCLKKNNSFFFQYFSFLPLTRTLTWGRQALSMWSRSWGIHGSTLITLEGALPNMDTALQKQEAQRANVWVSTAAKRPEYKLQFK